MNTTFFLVFVIFTSFQLIYVESTRQIITTKIGREPLWNATLTDKLKQDLLLNYDKFARPVQHTDVVTVAIGMEIKHAEINEFKSTLTVFAWTRLVWKDDKLKWDPRHYRGIDHIKVAPHEIWQPDIVLYNSAITSGLSQESVNLLLYANGEVLWVPSSQYPVLCDFDYLHWPFDSHVCSMIIGSWSYHGSHVKLEYYGGDPRSIFKDFYIDSMEWNITDIVTDKSVAKQDCCEEAFSTMKITLRLERKSPSYKTLIVTPTFAIIVLTLLSFWFSPKSGEKILLNLITILIIISFMMYFIQKIPVRGAHAPLIVQFYSNNLVVTTFCLINAVFVIWMSRTRHEIPLPWFIKNLLIGRFGVWIGLSSYITKANKQIIKGEEIQNYEVGDFEKIFTNSSRYQDDWILLAAAIDRISFVLYTLLFVILASK